MEQAADSRKVTVLVVEDEALVRLSAVALAEDHGFCVHEAADAEQAIAILESCPEIRIVLTDIQMVGKMNGLELAAYAHRRWPPLKFIIVSGEVAPSPQDMPEGSRFFAKPYDASAVGRALCSMV
ncbi:CheY-like chemotaxis protein [Sphingomonas leidyi]|uniref:CheY-like chemotaxis protein n=1 Tax=Sphingomonas leidyi TaxID=68569 RepID=A0A7X5V3C0_9SPHN|nr:response regulator [Sphingomonas leidyi]NIJ67132.1 CheY-like chemotaxis protein [Sphingomonas leidyi]